MTYRGPLYDQAPEELPDSPYKVLLNQTHADHQAIIAKAGTHLPAWLLHSLQVQNATILNEYERLAGGPVEVRR